MKSNKGEGKRESERVREQERELRKARKKKRAVKSNKGEGKRGDWLLVAGDQRICGRIFLVGYDYLKSSGNCLLISMLLWRTRASSTTFSPSLTRYNRKCDTG